MKSRVSLYGFTGCPPPTGLSGVSMSTEPGIAFIDRNLKMPTMKFTHRIPVSGTKDVVGNANWQPDWGGLLAGANELKVYVSATANGETTSTMSKTVEWHRRAASTEDTDDEKELGSENGAPRENLERRLRALQHGQDNLLAKRQQGRAELQQYQ